MSNKWLLVILLLVILPVVKADFSLIPSQVKADICPSNTILFTTLISSTIDSSYSVSLDGSASSFATAVPTSLYLNAGQSKNVYVYVTPRSTTPVGSYTLNLVVTDSNNVVKRQSFTINVAECRRIEITGEKSKESCSCNIVKYDYTVKNSGLYKETYALSVSGNAAKWISLSQTSLSLETGESRAISAFVNVPCDVRGDYAFTINVESLSEKQASFSSNVNVLGCFDYSVSLDKDYIEFCEHSIENIKLKITNNGNQDNSYSINVYGPPWANIENNYLNIIKGESGETLLILNPDYGVQGDFDITLSIRSQNGEIIQEKVIKAKINKCHGVFVEIPVDSAKVCSGLAGAYEVIIKNQGQFKKDFKIEVNYEWASLSKNLISLEPGQEERISLLINPTINVTTGSYDIEVKATALDSSQIINKDKIRINIVEHKDCYKAEIQAENIDINKDSSATLEIKIENKGTEEANYLLSVSGNAASFSQLNPAVLKLGPGKAEGVYLYIAPDVTVKEGNYKAVINVKLEDNVLASKSVNINILESKEPGVKKEGLGVWQKIKNFFNELFTIEIPGNITNITIPKEIEKPEEVEKPVNVTRGNVTEQGMTSKVVDNLRKYKYYWLILLIIVIVLVLIFKGRKIEELEELEEEEEKDEDLEEEEKEYGNIGKWILGIVILAIIVYLFYKYNLLNYLSVYKYYIIAGIIVLIILILIIKYWKQIVDFFEEEEKEEKKEEKPKPKRRKVARKGKR